MEHVDVELLALGVLSSEEAAEAERHLATCESCRERFRLAAQALALLPEALTPVPPPQELRAKVLRGTARMPRRGWLSWAGLAATSVAVLGLIASFTLLLLDVRRQLAAVQEGLALHRQLSLALWSQSARAVPLRPVPMAAVQANGVVVLHRLDRQTELVVLVVGLRPPPRPAVYQAWLQQGARRHSVGILEVDAEGVGRLRSRLEGDLRTYEGLGITLEPDGPVPAPRGTRVLNARF